MIDEDAMLKKYRPAFFEFYDMGMEARRLKNMRSVNGTTFLVDSTLSQWHDEATNLDLKEYEKVLPATLNIPLIHQSFTCSKWNMNSVFGLQFHLA